MKSAVIILPKVNAPVATDAAGRVNLTDIWKAANSPYQQRPAAWAILPSAVKYVASAERKLKVGKSDLLSTRAGRGGGTYAHPLVALEYARYLNSDLAVAVNAAFFKHVEEEANPELKAARAIEGMRRKGWTEERISARLRGIQVRNLLTETVGRYGVRDQGYRDITNAIYRPLLNATADEYRRRNNLPAKANVREHLTLLQLRAVEFAELLATENIKTKNAFGNEACVNECYRAGVAVREAVLATRS